MPDYLPGDAVQTPFGKGIVREVRHGGQYVVDVRGRALVLAASQVSRTVGGGRRRERAMREARDPGSLRGELPIPKAIPTPPATVDLHGLTVPEALARIDDALNEALLAGVSELRVIHGRSGGRIRAALRQRLCAIPSVRSFALDPHNAGVTIVRL
jgi:DNA mismatch repair protein MutS2